MAAVNFFFFLYNSVKGMESMKQILSVKEKLSFVFKIITGSTHCHCEPLGEGSGISDC